MSITTACALLNCRDSTRTKALRALTPYEREEVLLDLIEAVRRDPVVLATLDGLLDVEEAA